QQPLQCRPLQRAAGMAAIVIALTDSSKTFRALTGDIGLAGFALRIERVELHVEPFLARLSGVDRAAQTALGLCSVHRSILRASPSPKKRYPFQLLPEIALAAADSDLKRRPCHSNPSRITVTVCSTPSHSRTSRVPMTGLRGSAMIA